MFDDDMHISSDFVEGEMTVTSKSKNTKTQSGMPQFNTLDEPIKETFVSTTLFVVTLPFGKHENTFQTMKLVALFLAERCASSWKQILSRPLSKREKQFTQRMGLVGTISTMHIYGYNFTRIF